MNQRERHIRHCIKRLVVKLEVLIQCLISPDRDESAVDLVDQLLEEIHRIRNQISNEPLRTD